MTDVKRLLTVENFICVRDCFAMLFPFFCIKIYSYTAHYTKKFCFEKEKYISFYLSVIWKCIWYYWL